MRCNDAGVRGNGICPDFGGCNPLKGIECVATSDGRVTVTPMIAYGCNPLKGIECVATAETVRRALARKGLIVAIP